MLVELLDNWPLCTSVSSSVKGLLALSESNKLAHVKRQTLLLFLMPLSSPAMGTHCHFSYVVLSE